jgi:hypothetical protein
MTAAVAKYDRDGDKRLDVAGIKAAACDCYRGCCASWEADRVPLTVVALQPGTSVAETLQARRWTGRQHAFRTALR